MSDENGIIPLYPGRGGGGKRRRQLRLGNLDAVVGSLARIIREYDRDEAADGGRFRAIVYGMSILINGWKVAKETGDFEDRLAALEERAEEKT